MSTGTPATSATSTPLVRGQQILSNPLEDLARALPAGEKVLNGSRQRINRLPTRARLLAPQLVKPVRQFNRFARCLRVGAVIAPTVSSLVSVRPWGAVVVL